MKKLSSPGGPLANKKRDSGINARPFAVSDITCDIGGSIEFNFGVSSVQSVALNSVFS